MRTRWLTAAFAASFALTARAAGESADELLRDADTVLSELDAGRFSDVWLDATAYAKTHVPRDQFIADMTHARQTVGAVAHRGWASVTRIRYTDSQTAPDGLYANIDYATTLATGATVYEKLSFRLDADGHWRLTGYVPRRTQNDAP